MQCIRSLGAAAAAILGVVGCNVLAPPVDEGPPTGVAARVADEALDAAQQIGGLNGFGGIMMAGYLSSHSAPYMGFLGDDDLAEPDRVVMVELANGSDLPCVFHLAFLSSPQSTDVQTQDVPVNAGETAIIEMPCSEIIGLGSLTEVGADAATLEGGATVANDIAVPGFLGWDYGCGGRYACQVQPDTDDLDGDGDTEELIVSTDAFRLHTGQTGMGGHGHMLMGGR